MNGAGKAGILPAFFVDRLHGVDDRAVVTVTEMETDNLERALGVPLDQVHGDLTWGRHFLLGRLRYGGRQL